MIANGMSFYEAADFVCDKRPVVCPNLGFINQLQIYEKMKFQLEGTSDSHLLYQRIKLRSFLADERIRYHGNSKKFSKFSYFFLRKETTYLFWRSI